MKKISFVIPMYNVEAYIGACIDSILDQDISEKDFEIIVIDDGSTDKGSEIVHRYPNIKYFYQTNKGISAARNKGMELSDGEYIYFIDADDVLVPNSLKPCLEQAIENNLDMLAFSVQQFEGIVNAMPCNSQEAKLSHISDGIQYLANNNYLGAVWCYLVKRSFIGDLRFEVGHFWEDSMFTMALLIKAKRIAHLERTCYCYIRREGSVTRLYDKNHLQRLIQDYLFVYHYMRNLIRENEMRLSSKAKWRCCERSDSYLFFMFVRLIKFPDGANLIKNTINSMRQENIYPINKLSKINYPGYKCQIITTIINHPWMILFANKLYTFKVKLFQSV